MERQGFPSCWQDTADKSRSFETESLASLPGECASKDAGDPIMFMTVHIFQQKHGYTLIEILVVVLLISILTAVAIPNVTAWLHQYRLHAAASSIMNHLRAARLLAIFKGFKHQMQIRAADDGNYYQVVEFPADPDILEQVVMTIGRVVLHERFGEVQFLSIPRYGKISFTPRGTSTPCSITLENAEKTRIKITINNFGRITRQYL